MQKCPKCEYEDDDLRICTHCGHVSNPQDIPDGLEKQRSITDEEAVEIGHKISNRTERPAASVGWGGLL